ncbi:MAG: hypothetical protein Q9M25_00550 [Mariprofundaceae bacterium]|nr:hypothetical protein [Mariprofundaceae bacterium]
MKHTNLMILTIVLLLGSACATQHYNRLQPLTYGEVRNMSCQDINLEIVRARTFIKQTRRKNDELTLQDVTGFVTSLGIGNILEYNDAMKIAKKRLNQLQIVHGKRKCRPTGK